MPPSFIALCLLDSLPPLPTSAQCVYICRRFRAPLVLFPRDGLQGWGCPNWPRLGSSPGTAGLQSGTLSIELPHPQNVLCSELSRVMPYQYSVICRDRAEQECGSKCNLYKDPVRDPVSKCRSYWYRYRYIELIERHFFITLTMSRSPGQRVPYLNPVVSFYFITAPGITLHFKSFPEMRTWQ